MDDVQPLIVEQIKIVMRLNIPDYAEKDTVFTRAMLKKPAEDIGYTLSQDVSKLQRMYSEYPYFSPNRLYPMNKISEYGFDKRINFFFNKNTFEKILSEAKPTQDTDDDIASQNIRFMLKMFFPTAAPSPAGNNIDSFRQYIEQKTKTGESIQTIMRPIYPYSYLVIGNKPHTVMKTIWLNDFVNHPIYQSLIPAFFEFNKWKTVTIAALALKKISLEKAIETAILGKTDNIANDDIVKNEILIVYKGLDQLAGTSNNSKFINTSGVDRPTQIKNLKVGIATVFGYIYESDQPPTEIPTAVPITGPAAGPAAGPTTGPTTGGAEKRLYDSRMRRRGKWTGGDSAESISELKPIPNSFRVPEKIDDETGIKTHRKEIDAKDIDAIKSGIDSIEASIKYISSGGITYTIPGELKVRIDQLVKSIADIRIVENLIKKYFNKISPPDPRFETDQTIPETLKAKDYKKYIEFIKKIDEFSPPIRMTLNEKLQEKINNFTSKIDMNFGKYMEYIHKTFFIKNRSTITISDDYPLFIGACMVKEKDSQIYEIYVRVDIIGGELTSNNKSKLDCRYKGDLLGQAAIDQINSPANANKYKINPYTFYYDISPDTVLQKQKDSAVISKKDRLQQISSIKKINRPSSKTTGGARTRRRRKKVRFSLSRLRHQ